MKLLLSLSLFFVCLLGGVWTARAMTSSNYVISWDNVNTGGGEGMNSATYTLNDSIGQTVSGTSTSATYGLTAGYRADTDPLSLSMTVRGQSADTPVAYTAVSAILSGSKYTGTVDVLSASTFSVGDYIAVVQNRGFSATVAVGKVTLIVGNQLTIDQWDGLPALLSASPTGGDDFVYRLGSTSSIPFGTLAVGAQNTALAMVSVNSSALSYTVSHRPDGALRTADGLRSIAYCADGTVSENAEEYGVRMMGQFSPYDGVTTNDYSIEDGAILESTYASRTPVDNSPDRLALLFKINILSSTLSGTYAQSIYYTVTPHF